ncbi:hypothetical protein SBA7_1080005 [Candidatus Sulfotelmatobacter sp. SbA7]|nr:hypothetical protein SBA7_1080005 [Candidatus Sulfotelmatobacter sp. SbA7]
MPPPDPSVWLGKCSFAKVMKEAADELTFTLFRPSLSRPAYRIGPLHRLS